MAHPELKTTVCIVGAGPAGISAALRLSASGIPFILVEKENFPRDKICGDGFGGKGLVTLKRLDHQLYESLIGSGIGNASWGARFISPGLRSVLVAFGRDELDRPPGYVIRRKELDDFLFSLLKKNTTGKILESTGVISSMRSAEGITLVTSREGAVIHCKLLLLASGIPSKAFRDVIPYFPKASVHGLGVRAYYENISGFGEENAIEIHFLNELLPCYLWIFPLGNGAANVGLALPAERVKKNKVILKDLLSELINNYPHLRDRFSNAVMQGRTGAQKLSFFHGRIPVTADHVMLLGDAAWLVDPFTGEGIGNAMVSGVAAADVAAKAFTSGDFSSEKLAEYDSVLYGRLESDLLLSLRLRNLAVNKRLINLVIGKAAKSEKARLALRDVLFGRNSMKNLGKPVFYAKLLLGLE